jgi:hypothetical protein
VAYRTVHQWARYRLKSKLKVPRPVSEKQKSGAPEEFKKTVIVIPLIQSCATVAKADKI